MFAMNRAGRYKKQEEGSGKQTEDSYDKDIDLDTCLEELDAATSIPSEQSQPS